MTLGFYEAYANLMYPIFPPTIFKNIRGFTVILAGVLVLGMLFYSSAVLWPQQVRILYTTNPISVGWYASVMGISGTIAAPICGILFRKIGHARLVFTSIIGGITVFSALQALVSKFALLLFSLVCRYDLEASTNLNRNSPWIRCRFDRHGSICRCLC